MARELFELHVAPGKTFAPDRVVCTEIAAAKWPQYNKTWGVLQAAGPDLRITYSHDGVEISYWRRFATHLDDTDTFVDTRVVVDGKVVVDKKWQ